MKRNNTKNGKKGISNLFDFTIENRNKRYINGSVTQLITGGKCRYTSRELPQKAIKKITYMISMCSCPTCQSTVCILECLEGGESVHMAIDPYERYCWKSTGLNRVKGDDRFRFIEERSDKALCDLRAEDKFDYIYILID